MEKLSRQKFLKQTLQAGGFFLLHPLFNQLYAAPGFKGVDSNDLMKRLVVENDKLVETILKQDFSKTKFSRRTGYEFAILSASYSSEGSAYYQHSGVLTALDQLTKILLTEQADDGTVNIGNLESPPDTAFLLELLTSAAGILAKNKAGEINKVNTNLKRFIVNAGHALATGGVHTPNHRWVICAALSQINHLYPDKKYVNRIEDWLGEGVYIDKDGHYPERSITYGYVENNSLITMARLLQKPALYEPVRRSLNMIYYYMEPNGELVTNDSRRQDQYPARVAAPYTFKTIISWYLLYRFMAIRDNNKRFAAIARQIEKMKGFEEAFNQSLFHFLDEPVLQKEMPADEMLPLSYEQLFTSSHLLRIRRNDTTVTLFGGVDWPLIIASGRSVSPNFFAYRKGEAVLKYLRLSTSFFSTGYFYSEGIKKVNNEYQLYKKIEAPYYQPLPKEFRKKDGNYKLSPSTDGRFWNKMDFEHRPVSNVKTLETKVSLKEANGAVELNFDVTGHAGVSVTIEICFKEGGMLTGVTDAGNNNSFLEKGMGQYSMGKDIINFGPGAVTHRMIEGLEGERYSTHFGSLRTDGMHVYITGTTPFHHKLSFS
jgi:hypothetical protein